MPHQQRRRRLSQPRPFPCRCWSHSLRRTGARICPQCTPPRALLPTLLSPLRDARKARRDRPSCCTLSARKALMRKGVDWHVLRVAITTCFPLKSVRLIALQSYLGGRGSSVRIRPSRPNIADRTMACGSRREPFFVVVTKCPLFVHYLGSAMPVETACHGASCPPR